jgi:hypothetical protein
MPKPVRHPTVEYRSRSYSKNIPTLVAAPGAEDIRGILKPVTSPRNTTLQKLEWLFLLIIIFIAIMFSTEGTYEPLLIILGAAFPSILLWGILISTNGDSIRNKYRHCFMLGVLFILSYIFFHPLVALYLTLSISGLFFLYHRFNRDELVRGIVYILAIGGVVSAILTALRFVIRFENPMY